VVTVASGRPVGDTVDVVVGQSHAAGGLGSEDNVLATDASSLKECQ
jgi:hypothetical protein